MRVIILTQYYPPETGAAQNRLSDMARRFKAAGHDVQVLTAKPNYPAGVISPAFRHNLYNLTFDYGVPVFHCWLYVTRSKRILLRLVNYLSFVCSSLLLGIFLLKRADLLIVESPPLFLSISAWLLSRLKGAKMMLNVSDLYPATAIALGMLKQHWLQRLFYAFEAWSYQRASVITGQTQGIVDSIKERFPAKNVYLFTNGVDIDQLQAARSVAGKVDRSEFIVGYAGILGYAQNLPMIWQAAEQLRQHNHIEFHIYGDGPLKADFTCEVQQRNLGNVKIMGHRSRQEMLTITAGWDAGLVPLMNNPLMSGALPAKLFELMGMGLPVILCAPPGEASTLVARAGAGVWVEPGCATALADAILHLSTNRPLCRQLGSQGHAFAAQHYDRRKIMDRFLCYLHQKARL